MRDLDVPSERIFRTRPSHDELVLPGLDLFPDQRHGADLLTIEGDVSAFATIVDNLEVFMNNFKIVEP